jgi:uncharacterized repeat protein (TIGR04138 family)
MSGEGEERAAMAEEVKDLITVARETKYPLDAFHFVQRGLDFTVRRVHGEPPPAPAPGSSAASGGAIKGEKSEKAEKAEVETGSRHVTGQVLCYGLRDFAIQEYGLLARTVLRRWHINACEDFGRIVFAMVDAKLMNKTDEDSIRDFVGVYDFNEAFAPSVQLSEK